MPQDKMMIWLGVGFAILVGIGKYGLKVYLSKSRVNFYDLAYELVITAETIFGSGTGPLKYAYVIEHFYDKIPRLIRVVLTKKEVSVLIETAVIALKKSLNNKEK